jgi:hypothetical protein
MLSHFLLAVNETVTKVLPPWKLVFYRGILLTELTDFREDLQLSGRRVSPSV